MRTATLLLAALTLATTAAPAAPPTSPALVARLGETLRVGNQRVTPLRVIEDSRCPAGVACVWAGRVRVSVRIGRATREVTLGQPVRMAGGTLLLAGIQPERRDFAIPARAYRFAFRFNGDGAMELIRH